MIAALDYGRHGTNGTNGTNADSRERSLRFAVWSARGGGVEMRYFRSPQDAEGIDIRLTAAEAEALWLALVETGFHAVMRDDSPTWKGGGAGR